MFAHTAVSLALADGFDLVEALEAVFGVRISAMTVQQRADALRVLGGLDSCPNQPAEVRDRIPIVVHLLAEQGGQVGPVEPGSGEELTP